MEGATSADVAAIAYRGFYLTRLHSSSGGRHEVYIPPSMARLAGPRVREGASEHCGRQTLESAVAILGRRRGRPATSFAGSNDTYLNGRGSKPITAVDVAVRRAIAARGRSGVEWAAATVSNLACSFAVVPSDVARGCSRQPCQSKRDRS